MRLSALALGTLLILRPLAPASATTVLEMTNDELAAASPLVVRGKIVEQQSSWTADGLNIVTRTRVRVDHALKGPNLTEVVVRQLGGTLDGLTMAPVGDARLVPGEDVLLFLEPHPVEAGAFVLVAMGAAKFRVIRTPAGEIAVRDLDGLSFARPGTDGVYRPAPAIEMPAEMPVEMLLRSVERSRRTAP